MPPDRKASWDPKAPRAPKAHKDQAVLLERQEVQETPDPAAIWVLWDWWDLRAPQDSRVRWVGQDNGDLKGTRVRVVLQDRRVTRDLRVSKVKPELRGHGVVLDHRGPWDIRAFRA